MERLPSQDYSSSPTLGIEWSIHPVPWPNVALVCKWSWRREEVWVI